MKLFYDFHIHTALSPCADDDMTPNNVVNMSILKGLDAIAITDHNASGNCEVCMAIGKQNGIIVIPGMELQTVEDVHVVALFKTIEAVKVFQEEVDALKLPIPNRPDRFGNQFIMDDEDKVIGEEKIALITAVNITIDKAFEIVDRLDGIIFPAHIDRASNSIISNLGFMPENLKVNLVELSASYDENTKLPTVDFSKYKVLRNSDAHQLWKISEPVNALEVEEKTIEGIFDELKQKEK